MKLRSRTISLLIGSAVLLVSIACQLSSQKEAAPGSIQEGIASGTIRFEGKGNLTYEGCQDPTAMVILTLSGEVKNYEGQEYNDFINPVSVSAETDGVFPMSGGCEKERLNEKHNWPATGIYYPAKEEILFYGCSMKNGRAEGAAQLNGEGTELFFEGGYVCYAEDGSLVYEVAFSVSPAGN